MKKLLSIFLLFCFYFDASNAYELQSIIQNVKVSCSGISDDIKDLKLRAGINTGITSIGTVAGGIALGTGIAKEKTDRDNDAFKVKIQGLMAANKNVSMENINIQDEKVFYEKIQEIINSVPVDNKNELETYSNKLKETEQKSKTLGNIRTGTLAASTITNVAGTAIAATNKVDNDLETKINKCISATKELSNAKLAAKVENTATDTEIAVADKIINACRDYEFINVKTINDRATGAAVSSGIGIGTGVVGTITSAIANTDKTRNGDAQKEKSLNVASTMMSGATTVASATATIFNAKQIAEIKKIEIVANACEGALQ